MAISGQLKRRRLALGLTMQNLVDQLSDDGISLTKASISKYENGKSVPSATVLWSLSKALQCSAEYLMSTPTATIEWYRFRKKARLSKAAELRMRELVHQWLEAKLFVEEADLVELSEYELPFETVTDIEAAEEVAQKVRVIWNAGEWPIDNIANAIERSGIMVVEVDADADLDGVSGIVNNVRRFVVVRTGVVTDRFRMNLAHELGHAVIKKTNDERFDEKAAFRFGAALLMPAEVLFDRIGRQRRAIDFREFLLLKEEYGISVQALIRRCFDLSIITEWSYKQMNIQLRQVGWHKTEPGDCSHIEKPIQFRARLLRLLTEGAISEKDFQSRFPSVANELDKLDSDSPWRWRDLRNSPKSDRDRVLRTASDLAAAEYSAGGSLAAMELVDDVQD